MHACAMRLATIDSRGPFQLLQGPFMFVGVRRKYDIY